MKINREQWGVEIFLSVDLLRVDRNTQRELRENHIKMIVKEFNVVDFGRIIISKRNDGNYYIIDGQHRVEAVKRLEIKEVPCILIKNKTDIEDAGTFLAINKNTEKIKGLEEYRIGLKAENKDWVRVDEILKYAGTVAGNAKGEINYLPSIRRSLSHNSTFEATKEAFKIMIDTWGSEKTNSTTMNAMIVFYNKHISTNNIIRKEFISTMKEFDITNLSDEAKVWKTRIGKGDVRHLLAYVFEKCYIEKTKKDIPKILSKHVFGC